MQFVNIAAYKFVQLTEPAVLRDALKRRCEELGVLGSIILAPEGINLFVAAERAAIDAFLGFSASRRALRKSF